MNKIDQAILLGLTQGMPPEAIAKSLNIPTDWVVLFQENYRAPEITNRANISRWHDENCKEKK